MRRSRIVADPDAAAARPEHAPDMKRFDISELAREVGVLDARSSAKRVAIVVPLEPGKREIAEAFLAEGPPFDPRELGLRRHEVYLTDDEAIFVFEAEDGLHGLEGLLAENEFWQVLPAWEHTVAGRPRLAVRAFAWPAGT
jgi:hypothetical protein